MCKIVLGGGVAVGGVVCCPLCSVSGILWGSRAVAMESLKSNKASFMQWGRAWLV